MYTDDRASNTAHDATYSWKGSSKVLRCSCYPANLRNTCVHCCTHLSSPYVFKHVLRYDEKTCRIFVRTTAIDRIHHPCATRCCLYGARAAFSLPGWKMFQKSCLTCQIWTRPVAYAEDSRAWRDLQTFPWMLATARHTLAPSLFRARALVKGRSARAERSHTGREGREGREPGGKQPINRIA